MFGAQPFAASPFAANGLQPDSGLAEAFATTTFGKPSLLFAVAPFAASFGTPAAFYSQTGTAGSFSASFGLPSTRRTGTASSVQPAQFGVASITLPLRVEAIGPTAFGTPGVEAWFNASGFYRTTFGTPKAVRYGSAQSGIFSPSFGLASVLRIGHAAAIAGAQFGTPTTSRPAPSAQLDYADSIHVIYRRNEVTVRV